MDAELGLHSCRGTCFTSLLTVVRLDVGQLILSFLLSCHCLKPASHSAVLRRLLTVSNITETIDLLWALFHLAYKQYWKKRRNLFDCQWMLLPLLISSALNSTLCYIWVKLPVLVIPPLFFYYFNHMSLLTLFYSHSTLPQTAFLFLYHTSSGSVQLTPVYKGLNLFHLYVQTFASSLKPHTCILFWKCPSVSNTSCTFLLHPYIKYT